MEKRGARYYCDEDDFTWTQNAIIDYPGPMFYFSRFPDCNVLIRGCRVLYAVAGTIHFCTPIEHVLNMIKDEDMRVVHARVIKDIYNDDPNELGDTPTECREWLMKNTELEGFCVALHNAIGWVCGTMYVDIVYTIGDPVTEIRRLKQELNGMASVSALALNENKVLRAIVRASGTKREREEVDALERASNRGIEMAKRFRGGKEDGNEEIEGYEGGVEGEGDDEDDGEGDGEGECKGDDEGDGEGEGDEDSSESVMRIPSAKRRLAFDE